MKVFITFLGLFMLGIWGIVFQGDLGLYGHEQLLMKEAAEECAAGAATFLDEKQLSEGIVVFDYDQGRAYADKYLAYIKKNSKVLSKGSVSYTMEFEDEKQGYSKSNREKIPTVNVELHVKTEDLFRLPFIKLTDLKRGARYELPERS